MRVQKDENGNIGGKYIIKLLNAVMGRLEIILGKRIHSRILTQIFCKLYEDDLKGIAWRYKDKLEKLWELFGQGVKSLS